MIAATEKVILFAKRVREERKAMGLSQAQLADKVGVVQATVANWEAGGHNTNLKQLWLLTELFLVSSDYLIGISDERNPPAQSASQPAPTFSGSSPIAALIVSDKEMAALLKARFAEEEAHNTAAMAAAASPPTIGPSEKAVESLVKEVRQAAEIEPVNSVSPAVEAAAEDIPTGTSSKPGGNSGKPKHGPKRPAPPGR